MDISEKLLKKLDQIDDNLRLAIGEFPDHIVLDRLRFTLSLIQFIRTQLVLDGNATTPSVRNPEPHTDRHDH
jgi:hypothetical protein